MQTRRRGSVATALRCYAHGRGFDFRLTAQFRELNPPQHFEIRQWRQPRTFAGCFLGCVYSRWFKSLASSVSTENTSCRRLGYSGTRSNSNRKLPSRPRQRQSRQSRVSQRRRDHEQQALSSMQPHCIPKPVRHRKGRAAPATHRQCSGSLKSEKGTQTWCPQARQRERARERSRHKLHIRARNFPCRSLFTGAVFLSLRRTEAVKRAETRKRLPATKNGVYALPVSRKILCSIRQPVGSPTKKQRVPSTCGSRMRNHVACYRQR